MAQTQYGDISVRVAGYVERVMLEHQKPYEIIGMFGDPKPQPRNASDTVIFRRNRPVPAQVNALSEGIPPSLIAFRWDRVVAQVFQYGAAFGLTDKIQDMTEDPALNDMSMMMGENAGLTTEAVAYGTLKAGASVIYANGVASRGNVVTVLSDTELDAAERALNAQKAMKETPRISATTRISTEGVAASYIALGHTDLKYDIRRLTDFVPVERYGSMPALSEHEVGKRNDVRFILSPEYESWADSGGAAGGTLKSTTGTNADVYPLIIFGKHAFGHIPLAGQRTVTPIVVNPRPQYGDWLGQSGSVGWKRYYTCKILNELWITRIEVAATDL